LDCFNIVDGMKISNQRDLVQVINICTF